MRAKIQRLISHQAPTLLDASFANQLIDALNALADSTGKGGIKVIVEDSGRIVASIDPDTIGSSGAANLSIAVCNAGTPGYINVVADTERGFYTGSPDFPMAAP